MIRHAYQSITAEVDHMKNKHIKKIYILNLASVTLLRFLFTLACCGNKTSVWLSSMVKLVGICTSRRNRQILSGTSCVWSINDVKRVCAFLFNCNFKSAKVLACVDPAMPRRLLRNQNSVVLLNTRVLAAPQELSADALPSGENNLRHLCPVWEALLN